MSKVSRRDFLKALSLLSGATIVSGFAPQLMMGQPGTSLPNIIIIVFDAMSARNLSLYGYRRQTTPHLERFAGRATVFHSHYSTGNYTTPGTASLLTGLYPWTHRALNIIGLIRRDLVREHNIYHLFGEKYNRFAYSQNIGASYLIQQFETDIESILSPAAFSAVEQVIGVNFPNDLNSAYRAFDDFLNQNSEIPGSLVFGVAAKALVRRQLALASKDDYPRGLPRTSNYPIFFRLADVFSGITEVIQNLETPSLSYFHLWSPHAPYRPTQKFTDKFRDNWRPEPKPMHPYGGQVPNSHLNIRRKGYDEYIANVDDEFGKLFDTLDRSGVLDRSYVVVTSDHGESFERGLDGHITPLLYDPLLRIPLLISAPGQTHRQDIYEPTNSVDVLPTLLHLVGLPVPGWCEGALLPGLGGVFDPEKSTFSVEAKTNPAFAPLTNVSIAMRKGSYKMIYYAGDNITPSFELYDLESDMEELNDLYPSASTIAKRMQAELLDRLNQVNSLYH